MVRSVVLQSKPSVLCPAGLPSLFELAASPAAETRTSVMSTERNARYKHDAQLSMVSFDMTSVAGLDTL